MLRRDFLGHAASLALFAAGCRRTPPTREAVLTALVLEVVAPAIATVGTCSETLLSAAQALASSPSLETLRTTRLAWVSAILAWKRAQCFRHGPMVDTNAFVRTLFWPPRPEAIEGAVAGSGEIDDAFVANLGVDARGLYALEHLLFPLDADEPAALARFSGDAAQRRRELAAGLAASVAKYAANAGRALGDGRAYATRFAQGGQIQLSVLVNQMIGTVENLSAHRLDNVLRLAQSGLLKPRDVEGWPSKASHQIALAQLVGNERLYRGGASGGIAEVTRAAAPDIDKSVSEKYDAALAAVRALTAPLERSVTSDRPALQAAATATKALELALKVDLASALGVTITFQTGDGD